MDTVTIPNCHNSLEYKQIERYADLIQDNDLLCQNYCGTGCGNQFHDRFDFDISKHIRCAVCYMYSLTLMLRQYIASVNCSEVTYEVCELTCGYCTDGHSGHFLVEYDEYHRVTYTQFLQCLYQTEMTAIFKQLKDRVAGLTFNTVSTLPAELNQMITQMI